MVKKLYGVTGVPKIMVENKDEFRQDVKTFAWNEREMAVSLFLTRFQALMARIQIAQYNFRHPCNKMELMRLRAKRFRV